MSIQSRFPSLGSSVDPASLSLTVKGALVAVLPVALLVLKALGVEVAENEAGQIVDAVVALVGAVSMVMVIIGRTRIPK